MHIPQTVPLYDIDEIFAALSLEEQAKLTIGRASTPPPSYAEEVFNPAPNSSPPRRREPSPPNTPAPNSSQPTASSPTVYEITTPTKTTFSTDWSEAAAATQASSVRAVRKTRKRSKKAAYVVFRGRSVGVFKLWAEVLEATSGVRFALHQGYTTLEAAENAFHLALINGWACDSQSWRATPIQRSQAPLPLADDPTTVSPETPNLLPRSPGDPWYVVYAGINPGVFGSSLECALNVLGIKSSVHDRASSYADALAKFDRATVRGEVRVLLWRET
ncbi:hypothetical protein C8R46DRAFT_1215466 [Mycena filopes]|nr:hypothetical protein C8R46DRAFT_1215466 [Mycena filopes]